MLNAARAALSERGAYAKTHSGTWTLSAAEAAEFVEGAARFIETNELS